MARKPILRRILIAAAVILLLFIALVAAAAFLIDPDRYRARIEQRVSEATGRSFKLEGGLDLTLFPWIGVKTGKVTLGNAEGFGDAPFAQADAMAVRVKLLPLLKREVQVGKVTLDGLAVRLSRNAAGRGNWEDLLREPPEGKLGTPPAREPAEGEQAISALTLAGMDVRNGTFLWEDARTGERLEVTRLTLESGAVAFGTAFPLQLTFDFFVASLEAAGRCGLSGHVLANPAEERYEVDDLDLSVQLSRASFLEEPAELRFQSSLTLDLKNQTFGASPIKLAVFDVMIEGSLQSEKIRSEPAFSGTFQTASFSPRELLARLGKPLPKEAPPELLGRGSLAFHFTATPRSLALKDLSASADDMTVSGNFAVTDFDTNQMTFDLTLNRLDLDRLLPPPPSAGQDAASGEEAGSGGPTAPAEAKSVSLQPLKDLSLDGSLAVGELKAGGLTVADLSLNVKADGGRLTFQPVTAALYGGTYRGNAVLDARETAPSFASEFLLDGLQIGPLLRDLKGDAKFTGTTHLQGTLSGKGSTPEAVRKTLEGRAALRMTDGSYQGVDLARLIRKARATIRGESLPPEEAAPATDFTELTATAVVSGGVVQNDDLSAKSPLFRIQGSGKVDLVKESVDYLLTTTIVGTLQGQGGKELEELKGVPIPVRVFGDLDKPSYEIDILALVRALGKQRLHEQTDTLKEKLQDRLPKGLDIKKFF